MPIYIFQLDVYVCFNGGHFQQWGKEGDDGSSCLSRYNRGWGVLFPFKWTSAPSAPSTFPGRRRTKTPFFGTNKQSPQAAPLNSTNNSSRALAEAVICFWYLPLIPISISQELHKQSTICPWLRPLVRLILQPSLPPRAKTAKRKRDHPGRERIEEERKAAQDLEGPRGLSIKSMRRVGVCLQANYSRPREVFRNTSEFPRSARGLAESEY